MPTATIVLQVRRIRYPVVEEEESDKRPQPDPTRSYAEGWDPEKWDNLGWDIVQPSGRVVKTDKSMQEVSSAPDVHAPSERVRTVVPFVLASNTRSTCIIWSFPIPAAKVLPIMPQRLPSRISAVSAVSMHQDLPLTDLLPTGNCFAQFPSRAP